MIKSRFLKVGPTELGYMGQTIKFINIGSNLSKSWGDSALLSVMFATPDLPQALIKICFDLVTTLIISISTYTPISVNACFGEKLYTGSPPLTRFSNNTVF